MVQSASLVPYRSFELELKSQKKNSKVKQHQEVLTAVTWEIQASRENLTENLGLLRIDFFILDIFLGSCGAGFSVRVDGMSDNKLLCNYGSTLTKPPRNRLRLSLF